MWHKRGNMILGDEDLKYYLERKKLVVEQISEKTIRENGLDLKIDNEIAIEKITKYKTTYDKLDEMTGYDYTVLIDSHNEEDVKNRFEKIKAIYNLNNPDDKPYFIIQPHSLNLLSTQEYVKFPDDLIGFCALRSSVARHGFIAPITIVDAGFEGTLTIEVFYAGTRPFKLYVGDRFLHLIVEKTASPVRHPYVGIYKGQKGVRTPKCLD